MAIQSETDVFFLRYKRSTIKVKLSNVDNSTNLHKILREKFPSLLFPESTEFLDQKTKVPVIDIQNIKKGDVVVVKPKLRSAFFNDENSGNKEKPKESPPAFISFSHQSEPLSTQKKKKSKSKKSRIEVKKTSLYVTGFNGWGKVPQKNSSANFMLGNIRWKDNASAEPESLGTKKASIGMIKTFLRLEEPLGYEGRDFYFIDDFGRKGFERGLFIEFDSEEDANKVFERSTAKTQTQESDDKKTSKGEDDQVVGDGQQTKSFLIEPAEMIKKEAEEPEENAENKEPEDNEETTRTAGANDEPGNSIIKPDLSEGAVATDSKNLQDPQSTPRNDNKATHGNLWQTRSQTTNKLEMYEGEIFGEGEFEGMRLTVRKISDDLLKKLMRERRRLGVVQVENVPSIATSADLRILFCQTSIYSIHLLKNGKAFIEVDKKNVKKLTKQRTQKLAEQTLHVFESSYPDLLAAIRESNKCAQEDSMGAKPGGEVSDEEFSDDEISRHGTRATPKFENKDFKCVHMMGMAQGSTDLDIARFFDAEGNFQPLLMHLKKDGSEAYCEFASVRDCDKAVTLSLRTMDTKQVTIKRVRYSEVAKLREDPNSEFKVDEKDLDSYKVPQPSNIQRTPHTTISAGQMPLKATGASTHSKTQYGADRYSAISYSNPPVSYATPTPAAPMSSYYAPPVPPQTATAQVAHPQVQGSIYGNYQPSAISGMGYDGYNYPSYASNIGAGAAPSASNIGAANLQAGPAHGIPGGATTGYGYSAQSASWGQPADYSRSYDPQRAGSSAPTASQPPAFQPQYNSNSANSLRNDPYGHNMAAQQKRKVGPDQSYSSFPNDGASKQSKNTISNKPASFSDGYLGYQESRKNTDNGRDEFQKKKETSKKQTKSYWDM